MGKRGALLALVAVACLAAVPSAAFANRAIEVEPAGMVEKFTLPGAPMVITDSNGVVIRCEVTYREGWERRIEKIQGTAVAGITEGRAFGCFGENGIVRVTEVILQLGQVTPKYYQSFRGILPNIQSILLIANPLRILIFYREVLIPTNEMGCLFQGPVGFDTGGGPNRITRLIIQANQFVPLILQLFGTLMCPFNIKVEGTFQIAPELRLRLLNQ
ncbi:MAG: hypothetical protein ACTHOE_10400 [Conexibacter sp.]